MSDRHQELHRQRQLLCAHLDWLDQEIVREAGSTSQSKPDSAVISPSGTQAHANATATDEIALFKDYAAAERHDPASTKRGCLLAFAAGLGLLIATVGTVYFLFYAGR